MWDELIPLDVLARVFAFLPPDSLARAMSTCTHWHACARSLAPRHYLQLSSSNSSYRPPPPWLLAMPSRGGPATCCFAHDPRLGRWHRLLLDFLPHPQQHPNCAIDAGAGAHGHHLRLVASVAPGLLLCKIRLPCTSTATSPSAQLLRLALCNPFARHFQLLPDLIAPRCNAAVGVLAATSSPGAGSSRRRDADVVCGGGHHRLIVAGGLSSPKSGGGGGSSSCMYEPTWEMFDSREGNWREGGPMPVELAVRLTVWTPNESVHAGDGAIYWMTSARAYSVVGFHVERKEWREVKVPMAERLEWAALFRLPTGRLGLAGGPVGEWEGIGVWELRERDEWAVVGAVPLELGRRFCELEKRSSWGPSNINSTKCVGGEDGVYLFRELGSEMLVWRSRESACASASASASDERSSSGDGCWDWEWSWVDQGCSSDQLLPRIPITAVLLHPCLSRPVSNY